MALRYALLAHTVNGETHFDLLLEVRDNEMLRAYRLAERLESSGASCRVEALPAHRRIYLEYEGKISGDRGEVKRVESGSWQGDARQVTLRPETGEPYRLEIEGKIATRN